MLGRIRILVVDDELIVRESLIGWLKKSGYFTAGADSGKKALEMLIAEDYDLVFLDIKMPEMSGIEVLEQIKSDYPQTLVIMITAFGSVETAVDAMKLGANDYLMKPFDPEQLTLLVEKLLQHKKIIDENILLREKVASRMQYDELIGGCEAMRQLFAMIDEVAKVDSPVLLRGETGTGKELVAKAIHGKSERRFGPFIPINCGAFTETLLESELFGHETGSFSGACKAKKGRIEMAGEGTLFLDEIGEIPLKMQIDLLRVLEEKKIHRVGGVKAIEVDFRLVAATHRDLAREIERGAFRQDFYYRLNVVELEIPPLRARREDIPMLAQHFLERFRRETNKPVVGLHKQAMELLTAYEWPGNVRELENAVERAVVLAKSRTLHKEDFTFLVRGTSQPSLLMSMKEMEKSHIERVLKFCGGNISRAASLLELNRTTLHNKLKKYGLAAQSDAG